MDTLKTTTKTDTTITSDTLINRHTIIETNVSKKCVDCYDNICDCKLLSDLIWPLTIVIVFFLFRKVIVEILNIIKERLKNGDDFEFGRDGFKVRRPMPMQNLEITGKIISKFHESDDLNKKADNIYPKSENEYLKSYLTIENFVINKLQIYFSDRFKIYSNYRIENQQYDIILTSKVKHEPDIIIEIKYFTKKFQRKIIDNTILSLLASINQYKQTVNKPTKGILLIVLTQEIFNSSEYFNLKEYYSTNTTIKIISEEELKAPYNNFDSII